MVVTLGHYYMNYLINSKEKEDNINKIIGANIRKLRALKNFSQTELANYMNISCNQLQKYEIGTCAVTPYRMSQLVDFFNVSYSDLLDGVSANDNERFLGDFQLLENERMAELVRYFANIKDKKLIESILQISKVLAS